MNEFTTGDPAGNALRSRGDGCTLASNGGSACPQDDAGKIGDTDTKRYSLWLVLAISCLAALVDIAVASRSGLWRDEVSSLAKATGHCLDEPIRIADPTKGDFVKPNHPLSADEFRHYLKHDNPPAGPGRVIRAVLLSEAHPPLYFLLLYAWTLAFGTSDIVLRLFSISCSLTCLPFLASIARRLGGSRAVIPSCALFAFSPWTIYFATEGRMYSLLLLCVLVVMWASFLLEQDGASLKVGVVWIFSSAAGFLTQHLFIFPWLAIVAYLLVSRGRLSRLNLTVCLLLTIALILPWYLRLPNSVASFRGTPTAAWLNLRPPGFDRVVAFRDTVLRFFSGSSQQLWPIDLRNIENHHRAFVLFIVVAGVAAWRLRLQAFRGGRLLLWLVFGAACLGPLAFDLVAHTYTMGQPRYSIAALPSAYLLAGLAFAALHRRIALIGLALVILTWVPDISSMYRASAPWRPFREIARVAFMNASSSDMVLVHEVPADMLGIARYVNGSAPLASSLEALQTRPMPDSLYGLIAGRTRVTLVWNVLEKVPEEKWLRANGVASRDVSVGWYRIVDFRPINSKTF
jgi:Dolichyl-phosphate-mannose-protein mannosyltransferase